MIVTIFILSKNEVTNPVIKAEPTEEDLDTKFLEDFQQIQLTGMHQLRQEMKSVLTTQSAKEDRRQQKIIDAMKAQTKQLKRASNALVDVLRQSQKPPKPRYVPKKEENSCEEDEIACHVVKPTVGKQYTIKVGNETITGTLEKVGPRRYKIDGHTFVRGTPVYEAKQEAKQEAKRETDGNYTDDTVEVEVEEEEKRQEEKRPNNDDETKDNSPRINRKKKYMKPQKSDDTFYEADDDNLTSEMSEFDEAECDLSGKCTNPEFLTTLDSQGREAIINGCIKFLYEGFSLDEKKYNIGYVRFYRNFKDTDFDQNMKQFVEDLFENTNDINIEHDYYTLLKPNLQYSWLSHLRLVTYEVCNLLQKFPEHLRKVCFELVPLMIYDNTFAFCSMNNG
jgi:hypothetical protein